MSNSFVQKAISDNIRYAILDRSYTDSSSKYWRHKYKESKELAEVEKNRAAVASLFQVKDIKTCKQIHSNKVIFVESNEQNLDITEADAMISNIPGIVLSVLTADCVPVLFASNNGAVIGAAHAGWRGARDNILLNTIMQMKNLGAENISAIIGPSICQETYEVDDEFYSDFTGGNEQYRSLFVSSNKKKHHMFDLPQYIKLKLAELDVEIAKHINENTYANPDKYPSRRRSFHQGKDYEGNILSCIAITASE